MRWKKTSLLGFKPLRGYHDHAYDWGRKVELEDILQLANAVHETLKSLKVLYKIETEQNRPQINLCHHEFLAN